jgi:uncharacterized repeat protein (TIGR02543 family)
VLNSKITFYVSESKKYSVLDYYVTDQIDEFPVVEKEGYTFIGWYDTKTNERIDSLGKWSIKNLDLYAEWSINTYNIYFHENGGEDLIDLQVEFETNISDLVEPYHEGYTFDGWYLDPNFNELLDLKKMPSHDIDLYSKWLVDPHTIHLHLNGGIGDDYIYEDYGTTINEPIVEREGYTLEGWYLDSELTVPYYFDTMPAEDITVYTKWSVNQYSIVFIACDGVPLTENFYNYGSDLSDVNVPTEPIREGYIFNGWQDSLHDYMPAEDIVIYAICDRIFYNIHYHLDGGTNGDNPDRYTVESEEIILEIPTKDGYTFGGWFDNVEKSGKPITNISGGLIGDITLYADWILDIYDIEYNLDGGMLNESFSLYSILSPDIHLGTPYKEGYTFNGWYDNNLFYGDSIEIIENGSFGNVDLYAKWVPNLYQVNYFVTQDHDDDSLIHFSVGEEIQKVEAGHNFSSLLSNEGRLFMWGNNQAGQLGIGNLNDLYSSLPIEITDKFLLNDNEHIIDISLGMDHSIAVTSQGRVFTWGRNRYGELGKGTSGIYDNELSPDEITNNFNLDEDDFIVKVYAGSEYSMALSNQGRLFSWGRGNDGRLGNGSWEMVLLPTEITGNFDLLSNEVINEVFCGSSHSLVLTSINRVFAFGGNGSGQLGDGTNVDKYLPIDITDYFAFNINEIPYSISAGHLISGLTTTDGRVFMMGSNYYGQLGTGEYGEDFVYDKHIPTEISNNFSLQNNDMATLNIGSDFSTLITSKGDVYIWGRSVNGNLTLSTNESIALPYKITDKILLNDNEQVVDLSLGGSFIIVNTSHSQLVVWGDNSDGQLGLANLDNVFTPHNDENFIVYELLDSLDVSYDDYIDLEFPTREGYTFGGWYLDEDLTQPIYSIAMPLDGINLYGQWLKND